MLNVNDLSHKMKGKGMYKEPWLEKCHLYTHQVFPMTKVQWFLNRKHTRVYPEFHPHPLLGESMWKGDICCVHRKHSFTPRPKPLCSSPLHTLTPTSASKLSTAVTTPDTVSLGKGRLVLTQGFRSLRSVWHYYHERQTQWQKSGNDRKQRPASLHSFQGGLHHPISYLSIIRPCFLKSDQPRNPQGHCLTQHLVLFGK